MSWAGTVDQAPVLDKPGVPASRSTTVSPVIAWVFFSVMSLRDQLLMLALSIDPSDHKNPCSTRVCPGDPRIQGEPEAVPQHHAGPSAERHLAQRVLHGRDLALAGKLLIPPARRDPGETAVFPFQSPDPAPRQVGHHTAGVSDRAVGRMHRPRAARATLTTFRAVRG